MRAPKACQSCQEQANTRHDTDVCGAYNRQQAFNRRLRRLLADETPWHARPVPGPSAEGMPLWSDVVDARGMWTMKPDPYKRAIYAALDTDGAAYRAFKRALAKARVPELVTP